MATVLKIAMVGCGNISTYHLDAIGAASPQRADISCVIDPDQSRAEKLASLVVEKLGRAEPPLVFHSLQDACAADPDGKLFQACDVMVPSWETSDGDLHEVVALEVLKARRHLLLEKPIAVTVAAGQRLIAAHAELCPEKVFMVAENAAYWPEIVQTQQLLQAGAIGDVLSARAKYWESAMGEWAVDYLPGSWRCDESKLPAASFTFDGATHWIRPLRMWLGEVEKVAGCCGVALEHMAGPSMSNHVFRFSSGKTAIFESMLAPSAISEQPFFQIQGTKGEIVIDGFGGGARLYTAEGDTVVTKEFCKEGWDAGYALEYADFCAAVLDGQPLAAGPESAVADIAVSLAMLKASEELAWVDVSAAATDGSSGDGSAAAAL